MRIGIVGHLHYGYPTVRLDGRRETREMNAFSGSKPTGTFPAGEAKTLGLGGPLRAFKSSNSICGGLRAPRSVVASTLSCMNARSASTCS